VGGGGSYTQTGGSTEVDGSFTQGTLNIQGGSYTQTGSTTITGSATNAGTVLISANTFTAAGSFNNGGAVTIDAGATLDAGTYTQSEGSTLLNNGTLDPAAIMILGGTLGGTGMLVGNLSVAHAILHPGGVAGPGSLAIDGDFTQTGGKIIFDVYADGHGGFLESSLILNPGADFGVDNANIVFDFLGGADPLALFRSGEFGLDTFFLMSDGSSFSSDFDLSADLRGDTFSVSTAGYIITGFDPSDGSLQLAQTGSVPETNSTATLLAVGLGALTVARMRREGRDA
jgi:hypothetical protein